MAQFGGYSAHRKGRVYSSRGTRRMSSKRGIPQWDML
jgi:hypothetical protein